MVLRIFKSIPNSGFLTALGCSKFVFGRDSAPDPTGGAYSVPPDPLAGLRGPTYKEGAGEEWKGREKGKGGTGPLSQINGSAPAAAINNVVSCCVLLCRREHCHQCMLIIKRHNNILQYMESK